MPKPLALTVCAIVLALSPMPRAAARETPGTVPPIPYYMCFAYTQDGMFFAGGEFSFARAKRMVADNCGMPHSLKTVLTKTIMSHDATSTITYGK